MREMLKKISKPIELNLNEFDLQFNNSLNSLLAN